MTETAIDVELLPSIDAIPAAEWDGCACPEAADGFRPVDPFTTHRFLKALEDSGSVGPGSGWQPSYLAARRNGELIACAPLYAKGHSQGEYVFDHSWAHAYENAGGTYYPKMQLAVPFTPVTGRRFLVKPGAEAIGMPALVQAAVQLTANNNMSSLHVTFCTSDEAAASQKMGLMHRRGQQFHWENAGYESFDGFLAALSSRKRKNIRKERATAQAFGGTIRNLTGDEIEPGHWEDVWAFYQDTGSRKWGSPYLTRHFFDIAHETLRDDILLVLAERNGHNVAGALNFIGRHALFGRYWGALEHHPCLHFELCYYQAIDYAIEHQLETVEAGAQGEHKLARGYLPVPTHSLHWVADPGFAKAIAQFLDAEARAVDEEIEILTSYGPFRQTGEDHD
ncbi:GNAT family N-acetyltransferase [Aliiruegeria sabulilitoris]|uniref:GNAT family N-acetyltransferase n=1 Tax=Aliiruegeria sabulilitoris TaxID=1510458 RepID=UPI00082B021E|nr:GNAT family N-acetyltransferase [Aliiruegeria sabulilitoris]NDR55582.1 N-acetyltransferase [Pseudoruegeria sp. M32A2M]